MELTVQKRRTVIYEAAHWNLVTGDTVLGTGSPRRKQRPGGSRPSAFVNCARVDFVVLCAETTLPVSLPPPSQNDHSTARTIVSFVQLHSRRFFKWPAVDENEVSNLD